MYEWKEVLDRPLGGSPWGIPLSTLRMHVCIGYIICDVTHTLHLSNGLVTCLQVNTIQNTLISVTNMDSRNEVQVEDTNDTLPDLPMQPNMNKGNGIVPCIAGNIQVEDNRDTFEDLPEVNVVPKYVHKGFDTVSLEQAYDNPGFDSSNEVIEANHPPVEDSNDMFEDLPMPEFNFVQKYMNKGHVIMSKLFSSDNKHKRKLDILIRIIGCILYLAYFIGAIINYAQSEQETIQWCDGLGFLILLTSLMVFSFAYGILIKPLTKKIIQTGKGKAMKGKFYKIYNKILSKSWPSLVIHLIIYLAILTFLIVDTANERRRLQSYFGLLVFVFLAVLLSNNPARIR